jgi:hypothetical protein
MRSSRRPWLALAAAVALACGRGPARPELDDSWYVDLERAAAAATESGRPMLVVFR